MACIAASAVADAGPLLAEAAAIRTHLAAIATPPMVASYVRDAAGTWSEDTRGFIVPDNWPERARAFTAQAL